MPSVTVDPTGALVVDGKKVFPLGVSLPPPVGGKTPDGKDAWQELKNGGVSFVRTGRANWDGQQIDAQIAAEKTLEDAAAAHRLLSWLWPGRLPDPPAPAGPPDEPPLPQ